MASRAAKSKYKRQKGCCFFCGKTMTSKQRHNDARSGWTKDHFIPRCIGGFDAWFNIVLACQPCNTEKANTLPTQVQFSKFFDLYPEYAGQMRLQILGLTLSGVLEKSVGQMT